MWEREKAGEEKRRGKNQDGHVKENTGSDEIKEQRKKIDRRRGGGGGNCGTLLLVKVMHIN